MDLVSLAVSITSITISCTSLLLINNRSKITKRIFRRYCEKIKKEFVCFEGKDLSLIIELYFDLNDESFRTDKDILNSDLYKKKIIDMEYYGQLFFECCKNGTREDINIFEKYLSIKELYEEIIFSSIKNHFLMHTKELQNKLNDDKRKLKKLLVSEI